ncbi:MAG: hypothetical protein J2P17_17530 [Mycobacterium sp.]|nr:hypothetical protein [Mycobacterium sp.]
MTIQVDHLLIRTHQDSAQILRLTRDAWQPTLDLREPARQQAMPLPILWDTRTWVSLHIHLVALDDQHPAGVVGEDAGCQQAGNTAAQHTRRVEQNRRALGKIHPW